MGVKYSKKDLGTCRDGQFSQIIGKLKDSTSEVIKSRLEEEGSLITKVLKIVPRIQAAVT